MPLQNQGRVTPAFFMPEIPAGVAGKETGNIWRNI
jgi:hypothetical protein